MTRIRILRSFSMSVALLASACGGNGEATGDPASGSDAEDVAVVGDAPSGKDDADGKVGPDASGGDADEADTGAPTGDAATEVEPVDADNPADVPEKPDTTAEIDGAVDAGDAPVECVPVDCTDGNPCTDDECVDGTCQHTPNIALCDDQNPCTVGDACSGGQCKPGAAKDCDDQNTCTFDSCNPQTGVCAHAAKQGACDDGNACTSGDACADGLCAGGAATDCDDKNPCTDDTCDKIAGSCSHTNNTAPCDDSDPCTLGETCADGACKAPASTDCDDTDPCTDDTCDPTTGKCVHTPNVAACDDGNACTKGDTCAAGKCQGGPAPACDDGNPCTDDACDPATGQCSKTNNTNPCNDGTACTTGDACKDGACAGAPKNCDDYNACTTDACDPVSAKCSHIVKTNCTPQPLKPCTKSDECGDAVCDTAAHACVGCLKSSDCAPGLLCQKNLCKASVTCSSDAGCLAGKQVCSLADGVCVDCNTSTNCGPGKACVDHACVDASYCKANSDCASKACDTSKNVCVECLTKAECGAGYYCSASNRCTPIVCYGPGCSGKTVYGCKLDGSAYGSGTVCNDQNQCTDDTCNAQTGSCSFPKNTATCEDGNLCTEGEACVDGKCIGGKPKSCDDTNGCTDDSCDLKSGKCLNKPNSAPCDDGNLCTLGDLCQGGVCAPVATVDCDDTNQCTKDACDPKTGKCSYDVLVGPCDDNNPCTDDDLCTDGICAPGKKPHCDDANPCTDDLCDDMTGDCKYVNNTGPCDDGDLCTKNDTCSGGACKADPPPTCDDTNPCTDDGCDAKTGLCANAPNAKACDDGDPCTAGDLCSLGKCKSGQPKSCDDSNPCTIDACDAKLGMCTHAAKSGCVSLLKPCAKDADCPNSLCDPVAHACVSCLKSADCGKDFLCQKHLCKTATSCKTDDDCKALNQFCSTDDGVCVDCRATGDCPAQTICIDHACVGAPACGKDEDCPKFCNVTKGWCVECVASSDCGYGKYCSGDQRCVSIVCNGPGCASTGFFKCNSDGSGFDSGTSCDDTNLCTDDQCDTFVGGCAHKPNAMDCDDGNACTGKDVCTSGKCVGPPATCDDANACTTDACDTKGGCIHTGLSQGACGADGKGTCIAGTCCQPACAGKSCGPDGCGGTCGACEKGSSCTSGGKCQAYPAGMTLVAAGNFWMGCNPNTDNCGSDDEKPIHEVTLPAYFIDLDEVTNAKYKACVDAGKCTWGCKQPAIGDEQKPASCVSWNQAQKFCEWVGARLPTEAEWEKAARGGCDQYADKPCQASMPKFPWGYAAADCAHAVMLDSGTNKDGCGTGLGPVGSKAAGKSVYGLSDLAGNAAEWVSDWYGAGFYTGSQGTNPVGPASGTMRVLRGGDAHSAGDQLRTAYRSSADPTTQPTWAGFRCAKNFQ